MPPSSPKPETPPGRYATFEFAETDGRIYSCLICQEDFKEGDSIYIDPYVGYEDDVWIIVNSYWHATCLGCSRRNS